MPMTVAEANAINPFLVFGFGFGLVFVGLICIILICMIMGAVCKRVIKEAPVVASSPTPAAPKKAVIANKGEFAAAIAAAIAEENGTDVSGIRIKSIKQL